MEAVAEAFLNDVGGKNFDRAYQAMSKAYRAPREPESIRGLRHSAPGDLRANEKVLPAGLDLGANRVFFQLADLETLQPHDVHLDLVEEDGGWRVARLDSD